MRDRAQLTKKLNKTRDEEEQQTLENFKKFIGIVSDIYNLCDILIDIYFWGYYSDIEVKIKLNNYNVEFEYSNKNKQKIFNNYKDILSKLKK